MSDGMRDSNPMMADTSPRGIAISEFYAPGWMPGNLGKLLTALYDAGAIERVESYKYRIIANNKTVDCTRHRDE